MDGGAWKAAVHGVTEGRTQLSDFTFTFMHWRRKWQPTPVFLPGESQGRGILVGCCLWGLTESDTTEVTQQRHTHTHIYGIIAETHIFWPSPFSQITNNSRVEMLYTYLLLWTLFSSRHSESTRKLKSCMFCLKAHHKSLGKCHSSWGWGLCSMFGSLISSLPHCCCC